MSVAVERVDASSSAKVKELLQEGNRPFLITESVDERIREAFWTPSALRSLIGAREVLVTRADGGTFDYTEEGVPQYSDVLLPFGEAMDLIASSKAPGPCYYLRRNLLTELGVGNDEALPGAFLLTHGTKKSERLWASSQGSVTPLHYDTRNNLLTQMYGSKVVTLFPSFEHERMHPIGFTGTNLLSRVDPEAVDESRFPDFPRELQITVEFHPGDTLFIPPFWWHHVRSREFSISVNVFWQLRPEQCLVPNSIEYLRVMYKRKGLADLFTDKGEPHPLRFAKLAGQAHELGLNGAAIMFCAASARMTLQTLPPALNGTGADKTTAEERARLEHFVLLGGLAALEGKIPRASALSDMVSEVFQLASRGQKPFGSG